MNKFLQYFAKTIKDVNFQEVFIFYIKQTKKYLSRPEDTLNKEKSKQMTTLSNRRNKFTKIKV